MNDSLKSVWKCDGNEISLWRQPNIITQFFINIFVSEDSCDTQTKQSARFFGPDILISSGSRPNVLIRYTIRYTFIEQGGRKQSSIRGPDR